MAFGKPWLPDRARRVRAYLVYVLSVALVAAWITVPAQPAQAAGSVTATSLGWNVIGLDSNKVATGPNQYPLGAKVCNTTGSSQTVTGTWQWDPSTTNANINLASSSPTTLTRTLANGSCTWMYWTVEVTRVNAAYFSSRSYRIKVNYGTAPGTDIFVPNSSGAYRQLYVEKLVSQFRNQVYSITGPGVGTDTTQLYTGQEYEYVVRGATAPGGYDQVVFATIFPPSMFEIVSVSTGYSADSSALVSNPNDQTYADACGWNPTTRTCTGSGKAGGVMTTTYRVKTLAGGTAKLQSEIYDLSGASYHYNADYSNSTLNPSVTVIQPTYQLNVEKTVSPSTFDTAGQTLTYTIKVTNPNGQGGSLTVSDPLLTGLTCDKSNLPSGQTATCTGTYTVKAADLTRGYIDNTAVATGKFGGSTINAYGQDYVRTYATNPPVPGISVTKSAGVASFSAVGEVVPYTFTVTNSGQTALTDVSVTDSKILGPITCAATSLAIGASTTCSGNYTVTLADMNAGSIFNTATATALPPNGVPVSATGTNTLNGPPAAPEAEVVKSTTTKNYSLAGDKIKYEFVVTNTGNVTLNNVGISDPLLTGDPAPVCASTTLAPGASTRCFATHTVTQAEIDSGSEIQNTATATATPTRGTLVAPASNTVTVPETIPSLTLVKTASTDTFSTIGQQIEYTLVATNRGTADLTDVNITDPDVSLTCGPYDTPFVTGDTRTCTGVHIVTQADIDRGFLTNTAVATATGPQGEVSDDDSVSVTGPEADPGLSIAKTAISPSYSVAGDKIDYQFVLTNTGNVTLSSVSVVDPVLDASATCPSSTLAAGQSMTCAGVHTVTEAEATQPFVTNTATADANPARGILPAVTPSSADVPRTEAGLTVTKTASSSTFSAVGNVVTFTVVAENRGTAAINGFVLTDLDPEVTLSGSGCSFPRTMAVSEKITCTGTKTIDQADIDAGLLTNTVYGSGVDAGNGQDVFDAGQVSLTGPTVTASLQVDKTGTPHYRKAGNTIDYTFTVTNTGTVTIDNVTVLDAGLDAPAVCTKTSLAPGESTSCTGTHTVTNADVNAKSVVNTATATGLPVRGSLAPVQEATFTSTLQVAKLTVDKTVVAPTPASPGVGDTISYRVVVTNSGELDLTDVVVTDPKATLSCTPAAALTTGVDLAVNATIECTGTHVVTQSEFNASGDFTNTASATGDDIDGTPVTGTSSVDTSLEPVNPSLNLVKSARESAVYAAGDVIHYTITATNDGNVTMNNVTVTDSNAVEGAGCGPVTLAPGAHIDCQATHTVTEGDITAGSIENTARVAGTPLRGTFAGVDSNKVTVDVAVPGMSLTKFADNGSGQPLDEFTRVGQVVPYTFQVTNTGETELTGVSVTDNKITGIITCQATTLAVGESTTCTGDYTVTQTDMDAGTIDNTATASGLPPGGSPVTSQDSYVLGGAPAAPALTITKTAVSTSYSLAGDKIDYEFVVKNTGDVTLDKVTVVDANLDAAATCPSTTLAPGHSMTCTGVHTVTAPEATATSVSNTATATADPVRGVLADVTPSTADVPRVVAGLTVTKSADVSSYAAVGDVVTFTVTAENRGTAEVSQYTLEDLDPEVQLSGNDCVLTGTLAVGQKVTCTGSKTIDQADIDSGIVINTAQAAGVSSGQDVTDSAQVSLTGPVADPKLTLSKTGTPHYLHAGDVINYTFELTNTGNVTLDGAAITDGKLDAAASCPTTTIAPGATLQCTGSHTVTSTDVAAGTVQNTATATADPARGTLPPVKEATYASTLQVASLNIVKTVTSPADPAPGVGDTVDYDITVTNNGDVDVTAVVVADATADTLSCTPAQATSTGVPLAVGGTITCTATHKITQDDYDTAGTFINAATTTGTDPGNQPVSDTDSVTTALEPADPALSLVKSAAEPVFYKAGDTLTYTIIATNTGNLTLTDVTVSDANATTGSGCGPVTLAPGEKTECAATHVVTSADVTARTVDNVARATGTTPRGIDPSTDSNPVSVPKANPGLTVTKTAVAPTPADPETGDTISYDISVINSGDVDLIGVIVSDAKADTLTCDPAAATTTGVALAVNATITCEATHVITQADFDDAGKFANTATAGGTDGGGEPVTGTDTVLTDLAAADPGLSLVKSAAESVFYKAGETLHYTIVATNTGDVTLTGVTVTDANAVEGAGCGPVDLAPGEKTECQATHVVTAQEASAGKVENTAKAESVPARGTLAPVDSNKVTVPRAYPGLRVVKSVVSGADPAPKVADVIDYEISVTNTGQADVSDLQISDPALADLQCPAITSTPFTLPAGDSVTCTGSHEVTQADFDDPSGVFTNTASASGTDPNGEPVSGTDEVDTDLAAAAPGLSLVKSAAESVFYKAGETLHYTIVATNTGDVTLTGVTVTDANAVEGAGCGPVDLAPGEKTECQATHVVTPADVTAGSVVNTAEVTGTAPRGSDPSADDSVTVPKANPGLTVAKTADVSNFTGPGETITYTVTATNTGEVPVRTVSLSDPMVQLGSCTLNGQGVPGPSVQDMQPADVLSCTGSYQTTQADVDAGSVRNVATVSGVDGSDEPVTDEATVNTPGPVASPSLRLVKSANVRTFSSAGQTISYTFELTNTGNVSLSAVAVADPLLGSAPVCDKNLLAPLEGATCSGVYVTTPGDVARQSLTNTAVASAVGPGGTGVSATDSVTITVPSPEPPAEADLRITKTAVAPVKVDQIATFTLAVENRGPATADNVMVSDPLPTGLTFESASGRGWSCSHKAGKVTCALATALQPGQKAAPIELRVVAGVTAVPLVANTAGVTSSSPAPNPDRTVSTATLPVNRLAQRADKALTPVRRPGSVTMQAGRHLTNAGRKLQVRVTCTPVRPGAKRTSVVAGEVSYCKVFRHRGMITVKAFGASPVRARFVYRAKGTAKYRPFHAVRTYLIRPKR